MNPRDLSIENYIYHLPDNRIATHPLSERDASKLLVYKNGSIRDDHYYNISNHLPSDSLLLFNDTRVIEARLLFQKETGGIIEIFCLHPHQQYADIAFAMQQKQKVWWHCLIGGASKWKPGQVLDKKISSNGKEITLAARYLEKHLQDFIVELSWTSDHSFAEILHLAGAIPLPPYIKRNVEPADAVRYQTIYANDPGSVAAPTAGLHFTDRVFNELKAKKIHTQFVTLHVGAGTFKPVKSAQMSAHEMHEEFFTVSRTVIHTILENLERSIVAVGTTTLRTIESLYWIGSKIKGDERFEISQWEAYDKVQTMRASEALQNIIDWMDLNSLDELHARTSILIAPGYKAKIVKGLITNFHQPRSTLLLLVAALIGKDWERVYEHALKNEYRFLSYGDGSLLWF